MKTNRQLARCPNFHIYPESVQFLTNYTLLYTKTIWVVICYLIYIALHKNMSTVKTITAEQFMRHFIVLNSFSVPSLGKWPRGYNSRRSWSFSWNAFSNESYAYFDHIINYSGIYTCVRVFSVQYEWEA